MQQPRRAGKGFGVPEGVPIWGSHRKPGHLRAPDWDAVRGQVTNKHLLGDRRGSVVPLEPHQSEEVNDSLAF